MNTLYSVYKAIYLKHFEHKNKSRISAVFAIWTSRLHDYLTGVLSAKLVLVRSSRGYSRSLVSAPLDLLIPLHDYLTSLVYFTNLIIL
jgi:hypothetical protein